MISVFLSHANQDKTFVRELARALETDDQIRIRLDEREINPGENVVQKIEECLGADFVLVILSPQSVASSWVEKEWTAAFYQQTNERKVRLAVAHYRDCTIPHLLSTTKYFDLRTNQPEGFRQIRIWLLNERPAPPRPFHAPARPPLFIGREDELAHLREQVTQAGVLVHLQGMPGKGKTTLALEFAHRHRHDFEAVYWVPCQSGNLALIASDLATQLGLKLEGDVESNTRDLRDVCARKRCLLVLDNVEEEGPDQLIPGGSASVLITTRRDNLKFLRFRKPSPLPLFTEEQCFDLFRQVIGNREVDRHEATCRQLFQRLGRLPMGIGVAAGLIRYDARYTIPKIAEALPTDVPELIAKAVAALPPVAQRLLSAMAACAPEGFRFELAANVADLVEGESLDALQDLLSRSLAEELDRTERRYRLHALVREAAQKDDVSRRHAEVVQQNFQTWEADWRTCVIDLPDYLVSLRRATKGNESFVQKLAYSGYSLARRTGRLAEAYEICAGMRSRAEQSANRESLQAWLGNQAGILQDWGRLEEAMALLKQKETICQELGHRAGLQRGYGYQALILKAWGRLEEAMALHKQKEAICQELGDRAGLHASYGNQALILLDWGRPEEAMALLKQQEAICQELGDRAGLQASYGNQALILKDWGRLEEAMALHKQEEAICQELGDRAGLQASYGNQALILKDWGRLEEAMALHKQEEAICQELGDRAGLQRSYGNQALILKAWGRLEEAMALHQNEEAICQELGDRVGLAMSQANMALLLQPQGRLPEARTLAADALTTFRELKMPRETEKAQRLLDSLSE